MIFNQALQRIDPLNAQDAIKKMANHIKYIQEQLEYTLTNLDSTHIREIDTSSTTIGDSTGGTALGSYTYMTGKNGESFTVGLNSDGNFEFSVKGADGQQTLYLDSQGNLVITKHANLTIDGGEW